MKSTENRREFLGQVALAAMPPGLIGLSMGRRGRPLDPPGASAVAVVKAASSIASNNTTCRSIYWANLKRRSTFSASVFTLVCC